MDKNEPDQFLFQENAKARMLLVVRSKKIIPFSKIVDFGRVPRVIISMSANFRLQSTCNQSIFTRAPRTLSYKRNTGVFRRRYGEFWDQRIPCCAKLMHIVKKMGKEFCWKI